MHVSDKSFDNLPFSKLFQDYITNFQNLDPFFQTAPLSDTSIEKSITSYKFRNDRKHTVSLLKKFNIKFGASDKTLKSIERLEDEQAVAVVTGQQLTLYGGPLFTVYKILTAIHYAKYWEETYGKPCIPVFWLADEDHDYEEVATLGFPDGDEHKKITLNQTTESEKRVSEIKLHSEFEQFRKEIIESQFDTDFTDKLWRLLDECYQEGKTFRYSFGSLILRLFEDHGLILAGSADKNIKQTMTDVFIKSVEDASHQYRLLEKTTDELISVGYHGQVHLQYSNIFWINTKGDRIKISFDGESEWSIDDEEHSWTSSELIEKIKEKPEQFSPNVFLRPIIQNELLPGFAYIAGPGEIAYYAQMKSFYEDFNQQMPVIIPRFSLTLMESGIQRIFEKLPFDFSDYNNRIEDLESTFVEHSDSPDIEAIFEEWKSTIDHVSSEPIDQIKEIDPTLEGTSEKAKATFFTEMDKLKGKVYRTVKDQEKTQLDRIHKIKTNLFPNNNLQEREVAFIYFMNKYGLDIWDSILNELDDQIPNTHKIVRL